MDLSIAAIVAPRMYAEVVGILARDENVDMLLVIGTGGEEFSDEVRVDSRDVPVKRPPLCRSLRLERRLRSGGGEAHHGPRLSAR